MWVPVIGEVLDVKAEDDKELEHVVAVLKGGNVLAMCHVTSQELCIFFK